MKRQSSDNALVEWIIGGVDMDVSARSAVKHIVFVSGTPGTGQLELTRTESISLYPKGYWVALTVP